MNTGSPGQEERARRLMMAALDGEISAEDRRELDRLLQEDGDMREEWSRMNRVKEVTGMMTLREPPEEVWDGYWHAVYNRLERGVGWILVSVGTTILATWGVWKWLQTLFEDQTVPVFVKFALLALAAGFLLLLVSVIREKFFTWRRDPYRGVER